jgi:hypothetical protein
MGGSPGCLRQRRKVLWFEVFFAADVDDVTVLELQGNEAPETISE